MSASLPRLWAAALLAAGCSDAFSPARRAPDAPRFATQAPGTGIVLDQMNGTLHESGTMLIKGFNPTNPHNGDAIVVTFSWLGSTNTIDSVTDVLTTTPFTPVGNKYTLVSYVTAGGISMATYVATNVQNFPDAYSDPAGTYTLPASAGSLDSQWTWYFNSPSTWLATALVLNPAAAPPSPPAATQLAFTVQPSPTTAGGAISPPVRVAGQDAAGSTDPNFTGSITIALGTNPSGATLSGTKTATAVNGVATFANLSIDKAGSGYTLQATTRGLTGASSAAFSTTPPPPSGIVLDQMNGTLHESGTMLIKGFNPTNPHNGDAIVATFSWLGSPTTIDPVAAGP